MLPVMLALSGCGGGGDDGPGSSELNLVIGNVLPLTGGSKALGQSGEKASNLAIEQITRAAAETDSEHTVRAANQDQGRGSDSASDAAKALVNGEQARCLTGPWSPDAVGRVADDVATPTKVLQIAPVPASEDVTELSDRDLINSTALPESLEGSALSKAIERDLGGAEGHTVSVAASSDSYGDTLAQDFIEDWQDHDGTVSGQVVLSPPPLSSSSDFSAQAQQITSGGPDAVVLIDDINGFSVLAPALSASHGWDPASAWGGDQLVSPGVTDLVGTEAVDGMRALAPGFTEGEEASSAFVQQFKSTEPRSAKLAPFAAQEFDATVLCYLAAVAAGSTDGQQMADELIDITAPGGDQFSWQQLPDAVNALEDGKDIDYVGASGPIDMDVHGNPTSGVFDVYQYSGHRLAVVGEVSVEKNPATP